MFRDLCLVLFLAFSVIGAWVSGVACMRRDGHLPFPFEWVAWEQTEEETIYVSPPNRDDPRWRQYTTRVRR